MKRKSFTCSGLNCISMLLLLCGTQCDASFLSDPGEPGVRSLGPDVRPSAVTEPPCADLTDVSLADEDNNSILTDNANRAIQGNVAMQVTQPGGQVCN